MDYPEVLRPQTQKKCLWELYAVAAGAPAAVRVRNIATTVQGPKDAWQRGQRPQPALISATITFHAPPGLSAGSDSVLSDTVHYGQLSKAILNGLKRPMEEGDPTPPESMDFGTLVHCLWVHLTGLNFAGLPVGELLYRPFLKLEGIRTVELSVRLPKASLLGDGISGIHIAEFDHRGDMTAYCTALKIHNVRVPTLVGVNDNERQARQMVVANVELEQLDSYEWLESFPPLAAALVQSMSESAFETLEALASTIAANLSQDLANQVASWPSRPHLPLRISLEKPIAVVAADAACVELNVWTGDVLDAIHANETQ